MMIMERILTDVKDLPTLPGAVARLSQLLKDDTATAKDFEEVIRPDPALTANLLRLANSAYFGFTREITSVRQAVTLMGTKRIFEIAISGAFSQVIPSQIPGYEINAHNFWIHCVAVGVLSEKLAMHSKNQTPDLIFTAGLLHDIGKLVLGPFLAEKSNVVTEHLQNNMTFIEAERASLGTDHGEIGALVSQMWNLPISVEAASRWHHDPNNMQEEEHRFVVDLVHLANCLAHQLGFGRDTNVTQKTEPLVIERLGFSENEIQLIVADTIDQIKSMGKLFK